MTTKTRGLTATLEERLKMLSAHRRGHSERVAAVMESLAQRHRLDPDAARLAGIAHDLAREMSRPDLLAEAARLGIVWGPEEEHEPLLLHGPIAARWLQEAHLGTPSIWNAIHYHTTAAPGLDSLGRALFIADGVEPGRRFEARAMLYDLSHQDLDAGYCAVIEHTLAYLRERGLAPHPDMLEALRECPSGRSVPPEMREETPPRTRH